MISSIFYEWAGRALECDSVCFIGNPFSVYFSTRCTAFTAAGASRPCASTRIKIDGLRLVGGNPDSLTCVHAADDARFHDRQQLTSIYTLAGESIPT